MTVVKGYSPILTQASAKFILEQNTLDVLNVIPTYPVSTKTGMIIKENVAELRRNSFEVEEFNEQFKARQVDLQDFSYRLRPHTSSGDLNLSDAVAQGFLMGGMSPEQLEIEIARQHSVLVAQKILNSMCNVFFTSANHVATATPDWSNTATSTPITNVLGYQETVMRNSGFKPNVAIMTRSVYSKLRLNDQIRSEFGGGFVGDSNGIIAPLNQQRIATALDVERVLVIDTTYNAGVLGAAQTGTFIGGGNFFMLGYFSPNAITGGMFTNGLGAGFYMPTAQLTGTRIDSGYSNGLNVSLPVPIEVRKSHDADAKGGGRDRIMCEANVGYNIVYPEFGHLSTVTV
jgi:hypothetical protein